MFTNTDTYVKVKVIDQNTGKVYEEMQTKEKRGTPEAEYKRKFTFAQYYPGQVKVELIVWESGIISDSRLFGVYQLVNSFTSQKEEMWENPDGDGRLFYSFSLEAPVAATTTATATTAAATTAAATTATTTATAEGSMICNFVAGDGIGGADEDIGNADTAQKCAELVQQTRPLANGATYEYINNKCWAEFGMTGSSGGGSYQTCLFDDPKTSAGYMTLGPSALVVAIFVLC